jgi:hypothetical protein
VEDLGDVAATRQSRKFTAHGAGRIRPHSIPRRYPADAAQTVRLERLGLVQPERLRMADIDSPAVLSV